MQAQTHGYSDPWAGSVPGPKRKGPGESLAGSHRGTRVFWPAGELAQQEAWDGGGPDWKHWAA